MRRALLNAIRGAMRGGGKKAAPSLERARRRPAAIMDSDEVPAPPRRSAVDAEFDGPVKVRQNEASPPAAVRPPSGITRTDRKVLAILDKNPNATDAEVARAFDDMAHAYGQLSEKEIAGLVRRYRQRAHHHRSRAS